MNNLKITEKIGYGFGDMASSMFWKVFSYYLPFFYSNVFGLTLDQVALLLIVTRVWDAVSDPMMGVIADRTHTKWGTYRPYLLFMAVPFALCGVLLFTTPSWGQQAKLIYAYASYILMMTVYTGINVPYGAMLGVMTENSAEKTSLSSFRMFFAYIGSFIVLFLWEPLVGHFGEVMSLQGSWQAAMTVIAIMCVVLFYLTFTMTRERVVTHASESVLKDVKALFRNAPFWILVCAALCSNLFMTLRGSTVAYFFKDYIPEGTQLTIGGMSVLFYAGLFLSVGEISNMAGVVFAAPLSVRIGKKNTFLFSMFVLAVLSIAFFFIPVNRIGFLLMLLLQVLICIFTGVISPLLWSMYADVADYSEYRYGSASVGLIFSSSSMAQKFGSAFGGAMVMWLLAAFGYQTAEGSVQTAEALTGLNLLMSIIPAGIALVAMVLVWLYPLTTSRMSEIDSALKDSRESLEMA
ncbi:MAG: MFS transporter [Bacteroidales bacterium]|nr:MFS transporter [Bacteroidales bacterium]